MAERKNILSDWLFPRDIKCIVCDDELRKDTRYGLCDACTLTPIADYCAACGREVPPQNELCDRCREERPLFTEARSCFTYEDAPASLVWRLKYRNARYLAPYMAEFMTDTFLQTDWKPDILTFVPLHKSRRRERGYNQSQLLAEALGERVHIPVREILVKTVKTKNLAKLSRTERKEAIAGSFALCDEAAVRGKSVLLIDDVLTTGATSGECAKVLRAGGASEVYLLTFASVPIKPVRIKEGGEKVRKHAEKKIKPPQKS